jgi:hypothetical protein
MSNGINKPGMRQQQKSLSERLGALEENFPKIIVAFNGRINALETQAKELRAQVQALVELNGAEEVGTIVQENETTALRAAAVAEKASLEQGVADGYVVVAEKIGDKSILVGRYMMGPRENERVQEPGRSQLVVPGINPPFREQFIGQAKGFVVEINADLRFEVQEIYNVDEEKAQAFQAEQQKRQLEAATAKAADAAAKDEIKDTGAAVVETPAPTEPPALKVIEGGAAPAPVASPGTTEPTPPAAA